VPIDTLSSPGGGDRFHLAGQRAAIATMHGKEKAIGPVLAESLGLECVVPSGFDTDRFGTFTREIERPGTPLDAARAKIAAVFLHLPQARVAVASEGSFGPHPGIPFAPLGRELVLLADRLTGLEIAGHDASTEVNFAHCAATGPPEALEFAARVNFPHQGLIVMGCRGGQPDPHAALRKGIADAATLERAVRDAVAQCGQAFVETDMRAHFNPTRMRAIERAARDLARRFNSRCPACGYPGFDVTARVPGLPCEWCGEPTHAIKAEILACAACAHRLERPAGDRPLADPGLCGRCNP
jgi:hypothetical protein